MAKSEGIKKDDIVDAFLIKRTAGPPMGGKAVREIQRFIAKKDTAGLKAEIKKWDHLPTKAMIIRNLAMIKYRRPVSAVCG